MVQRIRSRLNYANVMATIAVFLALGGAAVAVTKLPRKSVGTKQLKNRAVTTKKIAKEAVTERRLGDKAVTEPKLAGSAVTSSKIAANAVQTGDIAGQAVTRAKVNDGAIPFLGTLRSGQELRGSFNLGGYAESTSGADRNGYTFQFPLLNQPSAPVANVIDVAAGEPFTASCAGLSGGNQQTPLAAPGNLCVYITGKTNLQGEVAIEGVTRLGFGLEADATAAGNDFQAVGLWAVTAP
jgi:hypothetical protein